MLFSMLSNTFALVAKAISNSVATVKVGSKNVPITKTPSLGLRKAEFFVEGKPYVALEQNPAKDSSWGARARAGHKIVQFKDPQTNTYVGVCEDGKVKMYPKKDS